MKILLSELRHPAWYRKNGISARGHAFTQDGKLSQGESLCDLFSLAKDAVALAKLLESIDGRFQVIIETEGKILAAVDRAASMPLYWYENRFLSDNPNLALQGIPASEPDPLHIAEYLLCGFVAGAETLQAGLSILPAGEILIYDKDSGNTTRQDYFVYSHQPDNSLSEAELFKKLDLIHLNCIKRLIRLADGRPIAIPLSGGYDSRLIALLLSRLGHKNYFTYCYGDPSSRETRYSKAFASWLDIPWRFIQHKPQDWHQAYQSPLRKEFYLYAGNVSSRPHIQDWLAVRDLQKEGFFPADTIFVPGHSGDFIEGSYIPASFLTASTIDRESFLEELFKALYKLWPLNSSQDLRERVSRPIKEKISSLLDLPSELDPETASSLFEKYYWREQQPKFIINSLRIYQFFGHAWHTPWWDRELLDFWLSIPIHQRAFRKLYLRYIAAMRDSGIPVYKKENLPRRIQEKLIRQKWGYIYDARYSRFALLNQSSDARNTKLASLDLQGINLPEFIDPSTQLAKCNINGLLSLVALKEWLHP